MTLATQLTTIRACEEAVVWAKDYESLREAWAACERGDWMLWLCGRMVGTDGWPDRKQIVLAACDCAELVLPIYEKKYPNDERVRKCIEVTRQWANGDATIADVRSARDASAAYAAYAADAAYAAPATKSTAAARPGDTAAATNAAVPAATAAAAASAAAAADAAYAADSA